VNHPPEDRSQAPSQILTPCPSLLK
jgi:hypothetical protein